jgi:hypothetical protein
MSSAALTRCEIEAVMNLCEYEVIKVAACRRRVSEHTQKNQIRSAMEKLGVYTQIGLVKAFFRMFCGLQFDLQDVRRLTAACLLCLFIFSIGHVDAFARKARGRKMGEIEIIE